MIDSYHIDATAARVVEHVFDRRAPMSTLGQQLKHLRASASLTQDELAEKIGVSQPTVSYVERGGATTSDVVERWIETCGGSMSVGRGDSDRLQQLAAALPPSDLLRLIRVATALPGVPEEFRDQIIRTMEMFKPASG